MYFHGKTCESGVNMPKKESPSEKANASSKPSLNVGDPAPDFSLQDDTGQIRSLKDFRGKKLVLYFYPKDATPGCTREACDFRDNMNRVLATGAAVVGVSADSVESHRRFKEKQGLNFPLLSDPEKETLKAYTVWQQKSLYGRLFLGIVRTTFIIDEKGKVAKVFPKVSVTGHVDEVLAALRK
jgi:peroxiredoxin Q/BCP